MIRDLLRLDTDPSVFYRQTMTDLEFINSVLDTLNSQFLDNLKFLDREVEADNILDTEWQFSQIVNEISGNSAPFSSSSAFPDFSAIIAKLRADSLKRKKLIEESYVPSDNSIAEPVVSNAELNGLLGSI
jgi:hypothetical protein